MSSEFTIYSALYRSVLQTMCILLTSLAASGAAWCQIPLNMGRIDIHACKSDPGGRFYVALGTNVLAVPFEPVWDVIELSYSKNLPLPPDPDDGLGCPDHPAAIGHIGVRFDYGTINPAAAKEFPHLGVQQLRVIAQNPELKVIPDNLYIASAEYVCTQAHVRETLANGLQACRIKVADGKVRWEDWNTSYIAPLNVYSTPLGAEFGTWCGPDTFSHSIFHCDVSYLLTPEIRVAYFFNPYNDAPTRLPIGLLIDFDQKLRAKIDAMRVPNYKWDHKP